MTRTARRVVAAGLGVALLVAAGCSGGDGDPGATAPSTTSPAATTRGVPSSTSVAPSASTPASPAPAPSAPPGVAPSSPSVATSASTPASSAPAPSSAPGLGPGRLVPGDGQAWTDLYPNGQPPVFPLPNSSRAFPAAQAAAIGFARDFLGM